MANETKSATKKKWTSQEKNECIWGWAFILPTMIGLIVLNIYPIFKTILESLYKTGDFGKGNVFVGLANYQKILGDPTTWQALVNTFKYAIIEVPFSIAIALVLAVLLNRKMVGRAAYRTIFFLPMVAAPAERDGYVYHCDREGHRCGGQGVYAEHIACDYAVCKIVKLLENRGDNKGQAELDQ